MACRIWLAIRKLTYTGMQLLQVRKGACKRKFLGVYKVMATKAESFLF